MAAQTEISARCSRTIHTATTTNSPVLRHSREPRNDDRRRFCKAHDRPDAWIATHKAIRHDPATSLVTIGMCPTAHAAPPLVGERDARGELDLVDERQPPIDLPRAHRQLRPEHFLEFAEPFLAQRVHSL